MNLPRRCFLPRLKVDALPDGRLVRNRRAGALAPIDDNWWRDVLLDPRAQVPVSETRFDTESPLAHYRLDRQRGEELMVTCACGRGGVFEKEALIEQMGPDANVLWVVRHLIDCGNRNKLANNCRAYCVR